jgi:hypothetical protein
VVALLLPPMLSGVGAGRVDEGVLAESEHPVDIAEDLPRVVVGAVAKQRSSSRRTSRRKQPTEVP